MTNGDTLIGRVRSATTSEVMVVLEGDQLTKTHDGKTYKLCQVGAYVKFPQGNQSVIGLVTEALQRDVTATSADTVQLTDSRRELRIQLVGSLREEGFQRGVIDTPTIDDESHIATNTDVERIFSSTATSAVEIGKLSTAPGVSVTIDADTYFAHHSAVLGGTGSGKSSAVACLLQKASQLASTHVVLLDLHNEYAGVFGDSALTVSASDLKLPYWFLDYDELQDLLIEVQEETAHNQAMQLKELVTEAKRASNPGIDRISVDSPIYFDIGAVRGRFHELDNQMVPGASGREKQGPFYGQLTRLIARLDSRLADVRYGFMFSPSEYASSESLTVYLANMLGYGAAAPRVTVLDLSGVPSEVLGVVVAVIGRLIFDFQFWQSSPIERPVVLALEEAHNYVPRHGVGRAQSAARSVERIAKEGRKYGLGLALISQRPSEISETVLSQAGTFVAMRLTNPSDQSYTRALVPDTLADIMGALPALERGEAIVCGESVIIPSRVRLLAPEPFPRSQDSAVWQEWSTQKDALAVEPVVNEWQRQARQVDGGNSTEPESASPQTSNGEDSADE